ncbi:MAG: nuclear transport factor 2 family protein [Saprospiraceae bacterium]
MNFFRMSFFLVLLSMIISCEKDDIVPEDVTETPSSDQQLIIDARQLNNDAIARHDAVSVASIYTDNFFILTSTNGIFTGKTEVENIYKSVFNSRDAVVFVRTPLKVIENLDWNMASEYGKWVGTWKVDGLDIEVGGDYYAKWHKIEGLWKLRCEVYTQFECIGDIVCTKKPIL